MAPDVLADCVGVLHILLWTSGRILLVHVPVCHLLDSGGHRRHLPIQLLPDPQVSFHQKDLLLYLVLHLYIDRLLLFDLPDHIPISGDQQERSEYDYPRQITTRYLFSHRRHVHGYYNGCAD